MTLEAKVGLFTVTALVLAFAVIAHLGNFSFGKQPFYKVAITFKNVEGLKQGAAVQYAGVKVGTVDSIGTAGTGAVVTIKVKDGTKIPADSVATISSDGLMGEKLISIYTPEAADGNYLQNGSTLSGSQPQSINDLMNTANKTLDKATDLLTAMDSIIGNKKVQESVIRSAVNLRHITQNMDEATGVLAQLADRNRSNVDAIIDNLRSTTAGMNQTVGSVEQLVNDVSGNGALADNLKATVANMAQTSARVEKMAANLEPVIADPKTAQDLRVILNNARNISTRTDKLMGRLSKIKVKTDADLLYGGKKKQAMLDARMKIYAAPNEFLLLGADDISGDNQAMNLQLGTGNDFATYRLGMVDDHAGVGIDTHTGRWIFSTDAYDFGDLRLKLRGQYRLSEGLYLLSQIDNANKPGQRETYFGVRKEF